MLISDFKIIKIIDMPIEVRELQIKAVVQDDDCKTNTASPSSSASSENNIDSIVERCIEQVLNILKEKQER